MKDNKGVCLCGGSLHIDEIIKPDNSAIASAPGKDDVCIYECDCCGRKYRMAWAEVSDVKLIDPDPEFLKGVDSANGRA